MPVRQAEAFDRESSAFLRNPDKRGRVTTAEVHAEDKQIDPAFLLGMRLYPDMYPLVRQVQQATAHPIRACSALSGSEPINLPNTETSFAELEARVDKTIAFIQSVPAATLDGAETREVSLTRRGETVTFLGKPYLLEQALPNFWFHVTTAYAILRHNGVEVGKKTFLGVA